MKVKKVREESKVGRKQTKREKKSRKKRWKNIELEGKGRKIGK